METRQVTVWDPLVRIMHWTLVLSFAAAYLTGDEWDKWEDVHEIAGYAAIGLILFRILWGFVGSKHARFSDFIYSPGTVLEYLKSLLTTHPKHYLGHNPAGGWMIILLMAGVLGTGFTGLKLLAAKEGEGLFANMQVPTLISTARAESEREEAEERREHRENNEAMGVRVESGESIPAPQAMPSPMVPAGEPQAMPQTAEPVAGSQPMPQPVAPAMTLREMAQPVAPADEPQAMQPAKGGEADEDEEHEGRESGEGAESADEHYWEELHELAANLTLFLVIIHVLGVIVSSRLHGENLARAMVTGKKNDQG
jgi:cytochrome b